MIKAKVQSGKLRMAIFYKAVLDQADFRDARLLSSGTDRRPGSRHHLYEGGPQRIYAPKAQFHHAQFNEATMESANLVAADLSGSNFTHANLTHANLQEANLRGATLSGADLTGADSMRQISTARRCMEPTWLRLQA